MNTRIPSHSFGATPTAAGLLPGRLTGHGGHGEPSGAAAATALQRLGYTKALAFAFALFNSLRLLAYAPTLIAIYVSADSSQHSLWTWCIWLGSNLTTAAWLYEKEGCRMNRVAVVSVCNALMCLAAVVLIVAYRV